MQNKKAPQAGSPGRPRRDQAAAINSPTLTVYPMTAGAITPMGRLRASAGSMPASQVASAS